MKKLLGVNRGSGRLVSIDRTLEDIMTNPIYLLSKKLSKHPWLRTPGDRVFTIAALLIGAIVLLYTIGFYRKNLEISNCQLQGGKPVYRKEVQREIGRNGYMVAGQEYQVFDRCNFDK